MSVRPARRLDQAHRDGGVCDRTFVLARCGSWPSPAARTHTGRLLERASLRSSRKVTLTGPRDPAAGAPPGSAAADAGTRTVAVSGAGAAIPAPAAQPRTSQATGRAVNTPPTIRARPPGSVYCTISPIRADFTAPRSGAVPRRSLYGPRRPRFPGMRGYREPPAGERLRRERLREAWQAGGRLSCARPRSAARR